MEDEECLPENSNLKTYLQSIGFSDVQVKKNQELNFAGFNLKVPNSKPLPTDVECLDENVIDEINILVSSQMLFEEDVSNIEKLLSSFKIVKNSILKSCFQGVFGVVVIFLGLLLYWIIGSYSFILLSSFYAYKAADFLWTKHFNKIRLKKLTSVLRGNYDLVRKIVGFIEENNRYLNVKNFNLESATDEFKLGFDCYNNFTNHLEKSLCEMIDIMLQSTLKLIKKRPLPDYIENHENYICNSFNKNYYKPADMLKLYQVYLLAQSEFLQRLILSLIPNLTISSNKFTDINKVLTETCVNLMKTKRKLNRKFKFIFINGIYSKSKLKVQNDTKNRKFKIDYAAQFVSGIHEASNTFQDLLIKSRIIEENIKSEKMLSNVEYELSNIQNGLNECQKTISDSFILLKKINNVICKKEENLELENDLIEISDKKKDDISIPNSDFDSNIEDEVFEAYFSDENLDADTSIDDWDFEDKFKKKIEKEFSENVLKELKIKLLEKAKNWEEREKKVLMKKFKYVEAELFKNKNGEKKLKHTVKTNEPADEKQNKLLKNEMESNFKDVSTNFKTKENLFDLSFEDLDKTGTSSKDVLNICDNANGETKENKVLTNLIESPINYPFVPNKNFLCELNQVRQRFFKTSDQAEEHYCYSNEGVEEGNSDAENF